MLSCEYHTSILELCLTNYQPYCLYIACRLTLCLILDYTVLIGIFIMLNHIFLLINKLLFVPKG